MLRTPKTSELDIVLNLMVLTDMEEIEKYNQTISVLLTECYARGKYVILPTRKQKEGVLIIVISYCCLTNYLNN